jgi:pimeloyl-ACP methyl ester carboxylesterase
MGGVVATAAAEQAPELFAELMYVSAFAPVNGVPAAQYTLMPENAGERVASGLAADPASVGALRYDTGDSDRHSAIREAFYNDDVGDGAGGVSGMSPGGMNAGRAVTRIFHRGDAYVQSRPALIMGR